MSTKHFIVSVAIANWVKVSFRANRWGVLCTNSRLLCIGAQHSVGEPKCLLTALIVLVLGLAYSPHPCTLTECKVVPAYCRESDKARTSFYFSIQSSIHVASLYIQTSLWMHWLCSTLYAKPCVCVGGRGLSRCKMYALNKNCLYMDTYVCQGMLGVMSVKWPPYANILKLYSLPYCIYALCISYTVARGGYGLERSGNDLCYVIHVQCRVCSGIIYC